MSMQIIRNFLSAAERDAILLDLRDYRDHHDVPLVERMERERPLKYRVVNGDEIRTSLPRLQAIYDRVMPVAQAITSQPIEPLKNQKVNLNINITPPGGSYRWHYDRNAVTAVLYLNAVKGGEIESYTDYRLLLGGSRASRLQSWVDSLTMLPAVLKMFGRKDVVAPEPGLLIVMRGDRCLHSVCEVEGSEERICIVMSFDAADAEFPQEKGLDDYLYTANKQDTNADPNYAR